MTAPARARPHFREFLADGLTPISVYRRLLRSSPTAFLLESVTGGQQVSRYSFIGADPAALYRVTPDGVDEVIDGRLRRLPGTAVEALHGLLAATWSERGAIPFTGGFVGFFGYPLVGLLETLPQTKVDPFALPCAWLGRFDRIVVFDHAQQRVLAVANEIDGLVSRDDALAGLADLSELLTAPGGTRGVAIPEDQTSEPLAPVISIGSEEFRAAVETAKRYIAEGEIFQVVLARRFELEQKVTPLALYRALRRVNPSPYMVLLETPEFALVGASPEALVRKTGRRLQVRPIAGTRRRGESPEEDRALADELLADPKERAEHVMLVDLGRNDLGRVAEAGSVEVAEFMKLELYSHVMHLVSSVEADLAAGRSALDALLATFPAGTVSGAPKIRAMELIDELEPEGRGPYAGAVGYLSYSGDLDTCITIRTLVVRDGKVSVTAGAGIVADSDPRLEETETENKAAALLAAVELARLLEKSGR